MRTRIELQAAAFAPAISDAGLSEYVWEEGEGERRDVSEMRWIWRLLLTSDHEAVRPRDIVSIYPSAIGTELTYMGGMPPGCGPSSSSVRARNMSAANLYVGAWGLPYWVYG